MTDDDVPDITRIRFRRLTRDDFGVLGGWLSSPHVHRWWFHDTDPDALERDFGASADNAEPNEDHLVLLDGEPFGLIQYSRYADYPEYEEELSAVYELPPGAVSVDYLIGDESRTGHGWGPVMIQRFVQERIWRQDEFASCVVVPVVSANRNSWRALEHAGFQVVARGELTPDNPSDDRSHEILRLDRPALAPSDFVGLTRVAMPVTVDPPDRHWTDDDWARIRLGHRSTEMDDRWHAYVLDDRLFLYRSWTGTGVFEAQFSRTVSGWGVSELLVCGDPSRFRRTEDDATLFASVVDRVLLGRLA